MSDRIYNFSAGPAVLPEEVLRASQEAIWNLHGTGIGVMEHSHRGKAFSAVAEKAEALCREVAGVPDDYEVLFLQGGASTQFFSVPMNFLGAGATADYLMTGSWSKKAATEAKRFGTVQVAGFERGRELQLHPRGRRHPLVGASGLRSLHQQQHHLRHRVAQRADPAGRRLPGVRRVERHPQPAD